MDGIARIEQNMVSLKTPMQKLAFRRLYACDFGRRPVPRDASARSAFPGAYPS